MLDVISRENIDNVLVVKYYLFDYKVVCKLAPYRNYTDEQLDSILKNGILKNLGIKKNWKNKK